MAVRLDSTSHRRCRFCDAHVTRRFGRVYGDGDDRAHRCLDCDTFVRVAAGSAAGKDVDIPDPQTESSRRGGRC